MERREEYKIVRPMVLYTYLIINSRRDFILNVNILVILLLFENTKLGPRSYARGQQRNKNERKEKEKLQKNQLII